MKLPVVSGRDLVKLFYKLGFEMVGRKGSHIRMRKNMESRHIVVTIPFHYEISRKTLLNILRQAEISRETFESEMSKL